MPTFQVSHFEHDGTPISSPPIIGGTLRWSYRMIHLGPGDIYFNIALSEATLDTDDFAPKRTDWKLVMAPGDLDEIICQGIMAPVGTGFDSDGIANAVRCSGLDYLAGLQNPWPFDYEGGIDLTDTASFVKTWVGETQEDIITDLVFALSSTEDAFTPTPTFNGTGWSEVIDYLTIEWGDDTSILDLIVQVAELGSPLGFDGWLDADAFLILTAPRLTDPDSVTPIYTIDSSNKEMLAAPMEWTNFGPRATDTVTLGSGSGNTRGVGFSTYQPSRDMYRRWTRIQTVDFASTATAQSAAASIGYEDRFPHKDLKLTIRPDLLDSGDPTQGFRNMLGQAIAVDFNFPRYHHVDAEFAIIEQSYYQDHAGGFLCDLSLSQLYGTSADPDP